LLAKEEKGPGGRGGTNPKLKIGGLQPSGFEISGVELSVKGEKNKKWVEGGENCGKGIFAVGSVVLNFCNKNRVASPSGNFVGKL